MTDIILVGNPNTGKTTLFNTITGKNNKVGNWHGVTVSESESNFSFAKTSGTIVDLPGIYSLSAYSGEEKVACDYLFAHKQNKVVCLCDANTLARNLLLALELKNSGFDVIVAINMAKEVKIDYAKLEQKLEVPVVPIDARNKKSVALIFDKIGGTPRIVGEQKKLTIKQSFELIDKILSQTNYPQKTYGTSKLDKVFLSRWLAFPVFCAVMLAIFWITFGPIGNFLTNLLSSGFSFVSDKLNDGLVKLSISPWAHSLIIGGIVSGVGVVISFLPQVVLINLCLSFLEDVGYLSRVAFMFDGFLKKVGLSGKSIMSILIGYGCTASAMLTTRALDSQEKRKQTALVIPFASCNAKLPIFLIVCSAFFEKYKVLVVFCLYLISIALGVLVSFVASKISKQKEQSFVMEMPPIRIQSPKKTIKNALFACGDFVKRVGTSLILFSVVLWLLSNITFSFRYAENTQSSMLFQISNAISPVFAPMGLNSAGIVVALITGLSAKEMVLASLSIANGSVGNLQALAQSLTSSASPVHFSPASAISFLIFVLLYSPCMSAIIVTAKELGKKFACFVFVFQFALAYAASTVAYFVASMIISGRWVEIACIIIVLALAIVCVIKYKKKKAVCKTCKGNCYGAVYCRQKFDSSKSSKVKI